MYGTQDAADYLEMTLRTFKDHVYRIQDIKGTKMGSALAFEQEELDRFKVEGKRGAGRPAGAKTKKRKKPARKGKLANGQL